MDIVYARLSRRTQAILDVLTAGFVILYCWILLRETGTMAYEALETGQRASSDWNPPLFPVMVSLPTGAAPILLQALAKLAPHAHLARTGSEPLPDPGRGQGASEERQVRKG